MRLRIELRKLLVICCSINNNRFQFFLATALFVTGIILMKTNGPHILPWAKVWTARWQVYNVNTVVGKSCVVTDVNASQFGTSLYFCFILFSRILEIIWWCFSAVFNFIWMAGWLLSLLADFVESASLVLRA